MQMLIEKGCLGFFILTLHYFIMVFFLFQDSSFSLSLASNHRIFETKVFIAAYNLFTIPAI